MDNEKCKSERELAVQEVNREFLHSVSRIADRLKAIRRDLKNLREHVTSDMNNMEEDISMLSNALESLSSDLLTRMYNLKENKDKDVEEI